MQPQAEALCQENVKLVQTALDQCMTAHDKCAAVSRFRAVPTRLIDLSRSKDGETPLETDGADLAKQPRWAALSYCWGSQIKSQAQFRTARDNYDINQAGFALNNVSEVVQDAVTAARTLRIRYMWVDAICIIQDDNIDWEQEAASMSSVYQGAYVTLVPLASDSCQKGFLEREQRPSFTMDFASSINPAVQGQYIITTWRGFATLLFDHNLRDRGLEEEYSPLAQRAWALQESMLSTRRLYFGQNYLRFKCPQLRWDESMLGFGEEQDEPLVEFLGRAHNQEWYQNWNHRVAEMSSRRALTHRADRLPSISGMAHLALRGGPTDAYVAGIWRGGLARGLL